MFTNLARFFIKNGKLTLVLVILMMITGISSYIMLPKQYNPQITLPAFEITLKAPNLSNSEISKFVVSPMENKIMELEGIDKVYGTAGDGYAGLMVQFNVGIDEEKAKVRLIQKLNENMGLKPLGVELPIVKTISADELSQITFAISLKDSGYVKNKEKNYIYLLQIANIIKEKLKIVENITSLEIKGGVKKDLIVTLDNNKLESRNISSLEVYNKLSENNLFSKLGNLNSFSNENILIELDGKIYNIEKLKRFIIYGKNEQIIYLEDVADLRYGTKRIDKISMYNDKEAVFLGIGKKIGTNAVIMTDNIMRKIEEIKKELPNDIVINVIQNEGDTAKKATNMLMNNLFQSIIIVFVVLTLSLGIKNALNTAISIPLTLFSVFSVALLFGENINRITLFALILVLGMLVDDSTVVVENINRHLKNREKEGKTKLQAILLAIKEVELGVILSTITRLLAFGAMFAVGDMMGEYMGPIPKFALMASIISTFVALTINPWISFYTTNSNTKKGIIKRKNRNWSIRKIYVKILGKFLGEEKKEKRNRRLFKFFFWITLLTVILGPIYIGVFKARMLPKSSQDQVYVWIDSNRGDQVENMEKVGNNLNKFFEKENIVKNISYTIGDSFIGDFGNLFRGGNSRVGENQLSARINLYSHEEYEKLTGKKRISSEKYVINTRSKLKNYLLEKYPDLKIQLLEDPPGPPVKATFLAKIKGDASQENKAIFMQRIENIIKSISADLKLEDIYNSKSTTYRKTTFEVDGVAINNAGLTTNDVKNSILISNYGIKINTINDINSMQNTNIILTSNNDSLEQLKNIVLKNNEGKIIALNSLINEKYGFVGDEFNSDKREKVDYIYGEMGNNSLIYPVIKLFSLLMDEEFLGSDYRLKNWNLYEINYLGLKDGKNYKIEWGGEWEVTMDTFRDLGIAMFISLLLIYLLMVGQFSSFGIAGVIMMTFLLGFLGVFPGFSILYLLKGEYFSATSMIGVIALGGIVVGNAIILIEYINILKKNGILLKDALLKAGYIRFKPIILTSLTTILGATTIIGDPVWSGLAWTIISGLLVSSILTLIVIPIFYYDSQKLDW